MMTSTSGSDLFESAESPSWAPLIKTAAENIRQQGDQTLVPASLEVLGQLLTVDAAAETAGEALLTERHVQRVLTAAQNDIDLQCSCIAFFIWGNRDFSAPTGLSWDKVISQDKFLRRLYARLRSFIGSATMKPIWNSYHNSTSAQPLLDALIRHAIDTADLGTIPLLDIVSDPDKYLYVVPWRLRSRFIWLLESYDTFWLRLEQAPLNEGLSEAAKLVSKKGSEQAEKVKDLLKTRLEKVAAEQWVAAIQDDTQPLSLAKEFFPNGELRQGIKSTLATALLETIEQLLASGDRAYKRRWFEAATMLTRRAEKEVHDRVCDALLSGVEASDLSALFEIGGEKLSKNRCFTSRPDDAVKVVVIKQMRTKKGRAWLRNRTEDVRGWLRRASPLPDSMFPQHWPLSRRAK